jgi:hypothetical protein
VIHPNVGLRCGGIDMVAKMISIMCLSLALVTIKCYGDTPARKYYTPIQYLKNYALSACISDGYQSKEVVNDAVAAAIGYKELGSLDIDIYNEAADLARTFLSKSYMSKSGEKLVMMKCIDFFYSKELDRLARKHARP